MKIGILTLHYGYNEGAILQAKALASLAEELKPEASAEIVDHRYPGKLEVYKASEGKRNETLQSAIDNWLPLSDKAFVTEDRESTFAYCREHYDRIIIGSDVVWGLRYQRKLRRFLGKGILPRQCDPFFPAFPNVYWPEKHHIPVRIAYAASCGNLWWEDIPKRHRKIMARSLDGFSAISYRDNRTFEFLSRLSPELGKRSTKVPDPTLAFDLINAFGNEQLNTRYKHLAVPSGVGKALLIMKESKLSRAIAKHLKGKGLFLATTGSFEGLSDIDIYQAGLTPLEWAWMPREYDFCVTERMHATIFPLLGHCPVLALDMNEQHGDFRTKLYDLMAEAGLLEWYLHQNDVTLAQVIDKVDGLTATNGYNWDSIESWIRSYRQQGRDFLSAALR